VKAAAIYESENIKPVLLLFLNLVIGPLTQCLLCRWHTQDHSGDFKGEAGGPTVPVHPLISDYDPMQSRQNGVLG
jgi:hypothetical protein